MSKKIQKTIQGVEQLSLGISMVAAVVIGVGIGIFLKNLTGFSWMLYLGVFWGLAGAVLNVYKAYNKKLFFFAKTILIFS